jgi:hypothetical protein
MEIEDIKAVLPHRYPFLLLDRVLELEPRTAAALALKNVARRALFHRRPRRPADPARLDPDRGHGPDRGDADPDQAREPRPPHLFHGHRPGTLPAPGGGGGLGPARGDRRPPAGEDGALRGIARVDGHVVLEGQMTFALADRPA